MGPSRGNADCARRSPGDASKDAGSIPATSTPGSWRNAGPTVGEKPGATADSGGFRPSLVAGPQSCSRRLLCGLPGATCSPQGPCELLPLFHPGCRCIQHGRGLVRRAPARPTSWVSAVSLVPGRRRPASFRQELSTAECRYQVELQGGPQGDAPPQLLVVIGNGRSTTYRTSATPSMSSSGGVNSGAPIAAG